VLDGHRLLSQQLNQIITLHITRRVVDDGKARSSRCYVNYRSPSLLVKVCFVKDPVRFSRLGIPRQCHVAVAIHGNACDSNVAEPTTVIENVEVSLNGGEPLSMTRTVTGYTPGPSVPVGVQTNTPL